MYVIVRSGGRQHKVAVGDTLELDRSATPVGQTLTLPAVLVVDGDTVTTDPADLAKITVTAEVLGHTNGPKIEILNYRNKTGYRRRMGHRQRRTRVRVTDIGAGRAAPAKPAAAQPVVAEAANHPTNETGE